VIGGVLVVGGGVVVAVVVAGAVAEVVKVVKKDLTQHLWEFQVVRIDSATFHFIPAVI
jgi:hypothetical protein